MSDYSLMNPDHLRNEIRDMETETLPNSVQYSAKLHDDLDRIREHFADQYNAGNDHIILTREQVADVLRVVADVDLNRWRYTSPREFALRVYKNLLKDRRWYIAAKYLRFLQK
jgi:hypothetical protein